MSVASYRPNHQWKIQAEGENVIKEPVSEFKSKPLERSRYFILGTPDEYENCPEKANMRKVDEPLRWIVNGLETRSLRAF